VKPDRLGRSKWQKVLPWYYTGKRQRSRQDAKAEALLDEDLATGRRSAQRELE
jgi:hypothetical protein